MSQNMKISKYKDFSEVDHVYVDCVMTNDTGKFKQASFLQTRTQTIVDNPADYYASIVRFEVPTHNIPTFVAAPLVGSMDVSKLTYSVTITYGTDSETVHLGANNIFQVSSPPAPIQADYRVKYSQYYSFYDYEPFLTSINIAMDTALQNLKLRNPGITTTARPFLRYDAVTGLISITCQTVFNDVDGCLLYFSNDLYEKVRLSVQSFDPNDMVKYANIQTYFALTVYGDMSKSNLITIAAPNPGAGTAGYINVQQFSSLWSWNDLVSIVITTNLPISPEVITGPISELGQSTSRQIFSDFVPQSSDGREIRNSVLYTPTAEYRLVDMISDSPIRTMQFEMWWQDNQNTLFPIMLDPFDNASIKLLFRKKSFNKK